MALDVNTLAILKGLVRKSDTNFRKVVTQLYGGAAPGFGVGKINAAVEQMLRMPAIEATLPHVPNKMDVSPDIQPLDPRPLTITGKVFRGRLFYYWQDLKDDQLDYWRIQAQGFGTAIARTFELVGHEPFLRAHDPTFRSGWDDKPLAHTAHDLLGGGTYDNTLPAQPPSPALLEQIKLYFANLPSEYGWPQPVERITIITPERYLRRWKQILGTNVAIAHPFAPSSQPNQNPAIPALVESDGVTVISSPYLRDSETQFAVGSGHELLFKEQWRYSRIVENDDPPAYVHLAGIKLFTGWGDARRVLVIG